ncbi:Fic family protein, partial [Geobacillus sp. LEMMJ02]|uniref:Fic family protein n=1 Tax=Geobacillus sp. LEMMJ02 TaxID=2595057 RepID=UPI001185F554
VHETLFENTQQSEMGGLLRSEPIWIGRAGCRIDEASFVAPPPLAVPDLLGDLVDYLNTTRHLAAMQAAVAHAQFETIHPFEDGNGRTGRALIHTVLNARGVASGAVPISAALNSDRQRYYRSLNATHVACEA